MKAGRSKKEHCGMAGSEELPGPKGQPMMFYDGVGYYYNKTTEDKSIRWLRCAHSGCGVLAKMALYKGAPITLLQPSDHHLHQPNPSRRERICFLHRIKTRHNTEETSFSVIFQEEAKKNPVGASFFSFEKIEKHLKKKINQPVKSPEVEPTSSTVSSGRTLTMKTRGHTNFLKEDILTRKRRRVDFSPTTPGVLSKKLELLKSLQDVSLSDYQLDKELKPSVRLPGPHPHSFLYHDNNGHYYKALSISGNTRHLECTTKNCLARAIMAVEENSPISLESGSPQHNHSPKMETSNDEFPAKKYSEKLLGPEFFHDFKGHYYYSTSLRNGERYLRCLTPTCLAEAVMSAEENAEIRPVEGGRPHNHKPDFTNNYIDKIKKFAFMMPVFSSNQKSVEEMLSSEEESLKDGSDDIYRGGDTPDDCIITELGDSINEQSVIRAELDINVEDVDYKSKARKLVDECDFEDKRDCEDKNKKEEYIHEDESEKLQSGQEQQKKLRIQLINSGIYKPSEKLPSRSNKVIYHNGEGYYFHFNSIKEKIMYLRCAEPRCKVRGWKSTETEDAPIIPTKDSPVHNHQPNFERRNQLLFLHRCKLRAASENLTLNQIWESEAARDPLTAIQVSAANVKSQMKRYRLEHAAYPTIQSLSADKYSGLNSEDGITFLDASVTDFLVGNDLHSSVFMLQDIHKGAVPEKIPSLTNETLWHAAGYFYSVYTICDNIEKVKCVEKGCNARAQVCVGEDGAPTSIRLNKNTSHMHQADYLRKDQLFFIDRCKRRAADSFETIQKIYDDEADSDPEVASQLSAGRVKRAMAVAKRAHMEKFSHKLDEMERDADGDMLDKVDGLSEQSEVNCSQLIAEVDSASQTSECVLSQQDGDLIHHDSELSVQLSYSEAKKLPLRPEIRFKSSKENSADEEEEKQNLSDFDDNMDQHYSDFVTLEDELYSHDEEALNTDDDPDFTPSPTKIQEKLYHDGNGYYYSLMKERNRRYLKCKSTKCGVIVHLSPREKPLLKLFNTSPSHRHPPDQLCSKRKLFLKNAARQSGNVSDFYESEAEEEFISEDQEESNPKNVKSSEMVHGQRLNSCNYHDGNGYYYNSHMVTDRYRYVTCVVNSCKARGYMALTPDNAPINLTRQSPAHNHPPDPAYEDLTYFLEKCKTRALEEDTPIKLIYEEECTLHPISSRKIVKENVIQSMLKIRSGCTGTKSSLRSSDNIKPSETAKDMLTDLDEDIEETENEQNQNESERSEILPGFRPNSTIYHDCKGYYFIFNAHKENKRYLRCIEPRCRVRGSMLLYDGSPIRTSTNAVHNHRPDFKRKNFVLFLRRCKERAMNENVSIHKIYNEECKRDPVSAAMISNHNMLQRMSRARKVTTRYFPTDEDQTEFADACKLSGSTTNVPSCELVDEDTQFQVESTNIEEKVEVEHIPKKQETVVEDADQLMVDNQTVVTDTETEDSETVYAIQADDLANDNTVYLYQPSSNVTPQRPTFCDDKGYCYQQTTIRSSTRYLKCIEEGCKARASMSLEENASITLNKQSSQHNHQPDQSEFTMLLDSNRLVSAGNTPHIQVIYTDENGGERVALCHISDELTPPKRPYRQRQKPDLTINTEEPVDASTSCELDVAGGDYYHNEDQQRYPLKPSEVIPGLRPDANNYHDGNGFYYELNRLSQNIRYLKCLIKDCKARAYMEIGKENAPIIQTNFARHNHGPDLFRKQFTVFLHRVTRRAAEEDTHINIIYQQEAERDPQSASQIRMENVKQRMMRFRKKHRRNNTTNPYENATGTDADMDGSIYHFFVGEDKDDGCIDSNSYYLQEVEENEGEDEPTVKTEEEVAVDETLLYQGYVVNEVEVESTGTGSK